MNAASSPNNTVISVANLAKSFGAAKAVQDVSFDVYAGEIFGLLGPNGAGKTTSIRMILDIFKPDKGAISVLGGPMNEEKKARIGYLPEERGLYKDLTVEQCVTYMAELKGVARADIKARAARFLEQFDLTEHRRKKVNELSKGMQQKVQIISTLIHKPALVIIDEPFSGLDPVNTRLVQDLLLEQRAQGTTIVMSTHLMYQVEEMCDRLVLIDHGKTVLYGSVDEIRRSHADRAVRVVAKGELPAIPGVIETSRKGNERTLSLPHDMEPQRVLEQLVAAHVPIERFELALPTMDDIFVKVVAGGKVERA